MILLFFLSLTFSDPPRTDHLTPATESAQCLRRDGGRVQEMDGVATEQITETGRTGRGPPLQTWPGKRNERDQCHANGTDGPARKSESPGRYEQQGAPPKSLIWIYYLVKNIIRAWRDVSLLVRVCVLVLTLYTCSC